MLAAVPDDYLYYGEGRNYDYGPGVSLNATINFNFNDRFVWSVADRSGWFFTVNGNTSNFFINVLTSEFRYFFKSRISAAIDLGYATLKGDYENYPDVFKTYPYGRASIGYKISKY